MHVSSTLTHAEFALHINFKLILTFAFCFRVDLGPTARMAVPGGGLMRELDNLQMDDFTDLCQGFNK